MIAKHPGEKSFDDALERALDKGAMLPVPDRVKAITTQPGPNQKQRIVSVATRDDKSGELAGRIRGTEPGDPRCHRE